METETPVTIYFLPDPTRRQEYPFANPFTFGSSEEEMEKPFFSEWLEEQRKQYGYVWSLNPPQGWVEN